MRVRWLLVFPLLFLTTAARADDAVPRSFASLDAFLARQVERHRLPALSIALVAGDRVVWSKGYGFADGKRKVPATARTVYRVGSVSKLFTDLAVMRLVEQGKLGLDAPVTKYLPDFRPRNPFGTPITLRQLMAHRSGLVREPPVGNYFSAETPSLAQTVASLNDTTLVYRPGTRTKYSNAGIAVVGRVLEKTQKEPFARYIQRTLLEPLGMKSASFERTEAVQKELAEARMWTYHGREFAAPTFALGMAPAGNLYAGVLDLARFLGMLFRRGKLEDGTPLVKHGTLAQMWKQQFGKGQADFGLGFSVRHWQKRLRVGHGGAVYGFATDLSALPDDRLGVAVVTSCDCANAVTGRIADVALEALLADRDGKAAPVPQESTPLSAGEARALAGRYQGKTIAFDLAESGGRLYYQAARGGFRSEVRRLGKALLLDDRLAHGITLVPDGKGLRLGREVCERVKRGKPATLPARWRGLLGEYGPDHLALVVLEKDGKLHVLIEWFFLYPLEQESENVYRFPRDFGLYHGEKLVFTRDKGGKATKVSAAGIILARRPISGEDGSTFRIKPQRSLDELRREALKARPPEQRGITFRKPELVELVKLEPTIKLDVRYATTNNFLGTPFYRSARAFLQKPAAEALVRVHRRLEKRGYGLMVFDGYRPWSVTKMFWDATPAELRLFVADPAVGSRHNRGCAVDLTLYDRKTGQAVEMPGGYDEMSDRSYPAYPGGTSLQRWHRDLLRRAMEDEGFTVYEAEWWHFDYRDWAKYPIGNQTFEELAGKR